MMSIHNWDEDEYIAISAVQHFVFCKRQVALIYNERIWEENLYTIEGQHAHSNADVQRTEQRGNIRIARGLLLESSRLGIYGRADVVEFHRQDNFCESTDKSIVGCPIMGLEGLWLLYPIEYKRGERRHVMANKIQLCAQALCLEEMFHTTVPCGAIYFGKSARRQVVNFDAPLREKTETMIRLCRELLKSGTTPLATYARKCETCSLIDICMPKVTCVRRDVEKYISRIAFEAELIKNEKTP